MLIQGRRTFQSNSIPTIRVHISSKSPFPMFTSPHTALLQSDSQINKSTTNDPTYFATINPAFIPKISPNSFPVQLMLRPGLRQKLRPRRQWKNRPRRQRNLRPKRRENLLQRGPRKLSLRPKITNKLPSHQWFIVVRGAFSPNDQHASQLIVAGA